MSPSSPQNRSDNSRCESTPSSSSSGSDSGGPERSKSEQDYTSDKSLEPPEAVSPPLQLSFNDCEISGQNSKPAGPPSACPSSQLEALLRPSGRRCYSCNRLLPLEHFALVRLRKNPGIEYRNPRCNQCRAKRNAGSKRVRAIRSMLDEMKRVPCTDCGNTFHPVCMSFDHVRGEKKFTIASGVYTKSAEDVRAEVAKCDVVCSNCLCIRTARRVASGAIRSRAGRRPRLAEVQHALSEVELPARNQREIRTRSG